MIDWTSWMDYGFMKMALAAILIITPLFGLMGTMIVNKKMAYFSDALGHSALTGIAVGVVCGIPDTNISMVIFAVVFALLLNKIGSRSTVSTDTIISVFSSCSVAIGLAILSKGGNFSKYSSLLVGDVLSITKKEIGYLVIIFIVTILFWITCFNWLNAICIHRALAKSKRIPVQLMDYVFAVLVALIVMLSIKWVGILIINALLILPAASSRTPNGCSASRPRSSSSRRHGPVHRCRAARRPSSSRLQSHPPAVRDTRPPPRAILGCRG